MLIVYAIFYLHSVSDMLLRTFDIAALIADASSILLIFGISISVKRASDVERRCDTVMDSEDSLFIEDSE